MRRVEPQWKLRIRKGDEILYCTYRAGGSWKPGGYQNKVTLGFSGKSDPMSVFGGTTFSSEKQAWWFWNQWKEAAPDQTEGWKPEVYEFEE